MFKLTSRGLAGEGGEHERALLPFPMDAAAVDQNSHEKPTPKGAIRLQRFNYYDNYWLECIAGSVGTPEVVQISHLALFGEVRSFIALQMM